jgi:hypothetical protein
MYDVEQTTLWFVAVGTDANTTIEVCRSSYFRMAKEFDLAHWAKIFETLQ